MLHDSPEEMTGYDPDNPKSGISTSSVEVGTPDGDQFEGSPQSVGEVDDAPVQVFVVPSANIQMNNPVNNNTIFFISSMLEFKNKDRKNRYIYR